MKDETTKQAVESLVRAQNPDLDDAAVRDYMRAGTQRLSHDTLMQMSRANIQEEVRLLYFFLYFIFLNNARCVFFSLLAIRYETLHFTFRKS